MNKFKLICLIEISINFFVLANTNVHKGARSNGFQQNLFSSEKTKPSPTRNDFDSTLNPSWLPPPVSEKSNTTQKNYTSQTELRALLNDSIIAHFVYPETARRRQIQGTVTLTLDISKNGELLKINVVSSPSILLENDAISQVKNIFPIKISLQQDALDFMLSLKYKLEK